MPIGIVSRDDAGFRIGDLSASSALSGRSPCHLALRNRPPYGLVGFTIF